MIQCVVENNEQNPGKIKFDFYLKCFLSFLLDQFVLLFQFVSEFINLEDKRDNLKCDKSLVFNLTRQLFCQSSNKIDNFHVIIALPLNYWILASNGKQAVKPKFLSEGRNNIFYSMMVDHARSQVMWVGHCRALNLSVGRVLEG